MSIRFLEVLNPLDLLLITEIRDAVIETKQAHMKLGAAKIGKISGVVDVSHPTVHAVLREAGFDNVTMRIGKIYKFFECHMSTTCGRSITWNWEQT